MKINSTHLIIAAFIVAVGVFFGLRQRRMQHSRRPVVMRKQASRKAQRVMVKQPVAVESASAGKPYQIFMDRKGRPPKSRYEYKRWLKENFTTDWEYWYDRYREYREYYDGYAPGSGPFTHKRHKRPQRY